MFRMIAAVTLLGISMAAPASAEAARGGISGEHVAGAPVQMAEASRARKTRRAQRNPVIIEQERLRIPNNRVIPPSAGGVGTTYSDRVVGCTHGAGVAGISGLDRGPAIHNCAFGH